MHASFGWYRIFPQRGERHPHVASFARTPQYATLLTPLDHLMLQWLELGWEPKHGHDVNNSVIVGAGGGGGGGRRRNGVVRRGGGGGGRSRRGADESYSYDDEDEDFDEHGFPR